MPHTHTSGVVAYQSDQVEQLLHQLILEMVDREQRTAPFAAARPFVDHCVVLPTRNLATYLEFEIAARRGISAGFDFQTIEDFLRLILPQGDDGRSDIRVLDQTALTRMVLSLLDDDQLLEEAPLQPVRQFVYPGEEMEPTVVERRKFQLAFRVARLFEEYGYARRNMLEDWRDGQSALKRQYADHATEADLEIEQWQMMLWRRLFTDDGLVRDVGDDEREWMTLPEAVFHYAADDRLDWPKEVHIFGHSYLPRFFRDLFSMRRQHEEHKLALYVLSPSRQHWSHGVAGDRDEDPVFDILTDDSILSGDEYPLALDVWGRAGRDYQRMIDDVADARIDVGEPNRDGTHTLLQHFQRHIRDMTTASDTFVDGEFPEDEKSVNFWSCASIQRECEAVASQIQELMQVHDNLRFNDIAVVVQPTDRTVYQTHLQAAFEQTGSIPCNVIDVEGADASAFLEAVQLLLELPLGTFRRRQLLSLLVHPCLVAGYPEADEDAWMRFCDRLNIFQGADADELEDTYLNEDRYTWRQGLRRLTLGAFISQPDTDAPRAFDLEGHRYLPYETNHGDIDTVAVLGMVADELIEHATTARTARRPLGEWMEQFADRISRHLTPRDRTERRTRMQFLGKLGSVADSDACPDEPVGYRTAFEFAMAAIADVEDTQGQYLADGVVVSAFRPMRPIPFQVVFVTGLGEGKFPAPDPPDMLDLRRVKSEPHDVNPRYRDQYMFLETLISTRSRLYLSWVGRHPVTGDPLQPASAVHQLREMLLKLAPVDGEDAGEIRQRLKERTEFVEHPLRRWDSRYFPELFDIGEPETIDAGGADAIPPGADDHSDNAEERVWPNHHRQAVGEAHTLRVRNRLDERLPAGWRPTIDELRTALAEGVFAPLADLVRWRRPAVTERRGDGEMLVITLRQLRDFLKCPLQGSAAILLGIYDEDIDDVLDADHEPFESDFLTRLIINRRALETALIDGNLSQAGLEDSFDRTVEAARLAGDLPAGVFFEAERARNIAQLRRYAGGVAQFTDDPKLKRIRFGAARRRQETDRVVDPIELSVDVGEHRFDVQLHGTIDALDADGLSPLVVAGGRKPKAKYFVEGGIGQLALLAADIDPGDTTVVTTDGSATSLSVGIDAKQQALGYLTELIADILRGIHDYFLPVELAAQIAADDVHDWKQAVEKLKTPDHRGRFGVSSEYGPVRRWQHVAAHPSLHDAKQVVTRRYAPFLEGLEQLGK